MASLLCVLLQRRAFCKRVFLKVLPCDAMTGAFVDLDSLASMPFRELRHYVDGNLAGASGGTLPVSWIDSPDDGEASTNGGGYSHRDDSVSEAPTRPRSTLSSPQARHSQHSGYTNRGGQVGSRWHGRAPQQHRSQFLVAQPDRSAAVTRPGTGASSLPDYEELQRLDEHNVRRGVSTGVLRNLTRTRNPNQRDCSICLDTFVSDAVAIRLPCSHTFHESCLSTWFLSHRTCPACRYEIEA